MKILKPWRNVITTVTTLAVMSYAGLALADQTTSDQNCSTKMHAMHHAGGHGHAGPKNFPLRKMSKILNLTDEQKQTLADRRDDQRAGEREQRQQLHQARQDLHNAVQENADEDKLTQLANHIGNLTAQQTLKHARDQQFFLSVLTPEQKEKLAQLKAERTARWHEE